jgi:hypothetical protein
MDPYNYLCRKTNYDYAAEGSANGCVGASAELPAAD